MNTLARILAPVDFSDCSTAALECATLLAERFGASIDVLYVEEPRTDALYYLSPGVGLFDSQPLPDEQARADARRAMETLMMRLEGRFIKVRGRIEAGQPCATILKVASDEEYDLIVMGTHGRTGFAHLISGSVAERVVRRARCAVLTVHAPQPATEAGAQS